MNRDGAPLAAYGSDSWSDHTLDAIRTFECTGVCPLRAWRCRILLFPHPYNESFVLARELAAFVRTETCTKAYLLQFFWKYFEVSGMGLATASVPEDRVRVRRTCMCAHVCACVCMRVHACACVCMYCFSASAHLVLPYFRVMTLEV